MSANTTSLPHDMAAGARQIPPSVQVKLVAGLVLFLLVALPVILVPILPVADPLSLDLANRLQPPGTPGHLLGTDEVGRDLLSRILWGGRTSLLIGVASVVVAGTVGTLIGVVAGYRGGWLDILVTRAIDAQLSLPLLLLLILVVAVTGPTVWIIAIVIAFAQWPEPARLARGMTLSERRKPYVEAIRSLGAGTPRILFLHILPHILGSVTTVMTLLLAQAVLLESALSYLGVGVTRPNPTWGRIIADGQIHLATAWWLVMMPGAAIVLIVLGASVLGEGIRQWFVSGEL